MRRCLGSQPPAGRPDGRLPAQALNVMSLVKNKDVFFHYYKACARASWGLFAHSMCRACAANRLFVRFHTAGRALCLLGAVGAMLSGRGPTECARFAMRCTDTYADVNIDRQI